MDMRDRSGYRLATIALSIPFFLVSCGSHQMTVDFLGPAPADDAMLDGIEFRVDVKDHAGMLMQTGPGMTEYIKTVLNRPRSEIVKSALSQAFTERGAVIDDKSTTVLRVTISRFHMFIAPSGWQGEGVAMVELEASVTKEGRLLVSPQESRAMEETSLGMFTLPWNTMKPSLDRCLTRAVIDMVESVGREMQSRARSYSSPSVGVTGTCFAVTQDGWLITANHVVSDSTAVEIRAGDLWVSARVVARDEDHDIALLRVGVPTPDYLTIGSDVDPRIGQSVYTLGFPLPGILTQDVRYNDGTVSATSAFDDSPGLFQVSVPVQPGNSGGPLLNEAGQVLGLVVSKAADLAFLAETGSLPENMSFAVGSDAIRPLLDIADAHNPPTGALTVEEVARAVYMLRAR